VNKSQSRFFIALLPPREIQDYANQIRQIFAEHYASRGAQNSPPHITLQPPFEWANAEVPLLEECLRQFSLLRQSVPVTLNGYGAFAPRVIYINVVRNQELLTLQAELMAHLETNLGIADKVSKTRPFAPHMTVAFKDLTKQNFQVAWQEFGKQQLHFEFIANNFTLLLHDSKRWNVKTQFPFAPDNN
jgi:2'-5' RNA ligase